jgi:hypothetical protein
MTNIEKFFEKVKKNNPVSLELTRNNQKES